MMGIVRSRNSTGVVSGEFKRSQTLSRLRRCYIYSQHSSPILRLITTDDPGSFLAAFLTSVEIDANWA